LSLLWLLVAGAEGGAVSPALQEKLSLLFSSSDGGGVGHAAGSAESHTPVSRNRVWRMVNSLAVCTDTSQSRHRIARSSLQNRSPRFSCTTSKTDSEHKKASSFGSRDYHKHPSNIYKQSRAHGCRVAERTNQ
jgi:hypothetical protein